MTFCLNSTIIRPENGTKIKNAIILLHGYGGDGQDISMVSLNWKRYLPNTIFICPNGIEPCSINPKGYQWFDLSDNQDNTLDQSKKAEKKLFKFIEEIKQEFNLDNNKICLSGFSQGCMMSLSIGLTSTENFNCIIGFSGKILDQKDLQSRKKNSTKVLLIHGDSDQIVHPNFMLEAKDFLIRNNIEVETHLIKDCDHHISIEASSIALKYFLDKI
jgi:phospholipase/carboxylesterase